MARAILELIGDPDSLLKSFKKSSAAADKFGKDLKQLGTTADQSARAQIQASIKRDERLRAEVRAYRQVADAAQKGSREQIAAARLAERAQDSLTRSILATEREQKRASIGIGKEFRGGLAGSGALSGAGRALAFGSVGFLGGFAASAGIRDIIEQASTIQEETEKTTEVFGKSARAVQAWSRTLAESFGVSEGEALKAAGVFGNMFRSLHFGQDDAATMSQRLVELAADMASFNNASPEDTLRALQSGLAGQVRPLRQFGVFLSQDRIKQEALASGIAKNTAHLTAAQKVQASYNIILRDTALAQGDVARNSESLAVSQSKLRAELKNNEAAIGRQALPLVVKSTNILSKSLGFLHTKTFQVASGFILAKSAAETLANAVRAVNTELSSYNGQVARPVSGEDVFLRGSSSVAGVGVPTGGRGGRRSRASLSYQISLANLFLSQAELTATKRDDRYRLVRLRALERQKLSVTKGLAERTAITQQIVSLDGQIASLDAQAANERKTAADKALAARKAALAAEADRLAKLKSAADDELGKLKQREGALTSKIKQIQDNFRSAVQTARQGIGELFGGPVLNFSDEQRKAALGIPNPAADPRSLVRDLRAQVNAETVRQRNIRAIERGLPKGALRSRLVGELQSNTGDAAQVAALARSPRLARQFFEQFGRRERLARSVARMQVHAQLVSLHAVRVRLSDVRAREQHIQVFIEGVEQKQARVKVKQSAAQRRGPVPGRS